jgi:hypothetical protein
MAKNISKKFRNYTAGVLSSLSIFVSIAIFDSYLTNQAYCPPHYNQSVLELVVSEYPDYNLSFRRSSALGSRPLLFAVSALPGFFKNRRYSYIDHNSIVLTFLKTYNTGYSSILHQIYCIRKCNSGGSSPDDYFSLC